MNRKSLLRGVILGALSTGLAGAAFLACTGDDTTVTPDAGPDVVVQDALPAQVDYVSATSPVGTVSYDAATRTVTASLGTLAAHQEVVIAIQARINANAATPSPIINQATIIYGRTRGTGSSNTVTAELVPGSLPETGFGPGPREIVTFSLILGMAALTALALYDRSRKPETQEQPEIIKK